MTMSILAEECQKNKDGEKVLTQILTILIVLSSGIVSGASFAWTSPYVVQITQDKIKYDITEDEASIFVFLQSISFGFFGLFAPRLADLLGRKPCMFLMVIPQATFWITTALTTSIYGFYAARIIAGMADAVLFSIVPVYIGEIAIPRIRGAWGNVMCYYLLGQLVINVIGQWFTVREASYICLPMCVVYLILLTLVPESPYYHLMNEKEEEAKRSLRFLRRKQDVDKEFLQLKSDVARQMSETGHWRDLIGIASNRKALLALIILRVSQQLSGITCFQSYTQYIFVKSGSTINSGLSTIIITFLNFFMTFCSGFLGERFGRKKTFLASLLSCSVVLLFEATFFYVDQNTDVDLTFMPWFPLLGMVCFIVFSALGITPIPSQMTGELFSSSVKAKGTSFMTCFTGLIIALNLACFYQMDSNFGLYVPFGFFGVCGIASMPLVARFTPETKGRTLEEIQQGLKMKEKVLNGKEGEGPCCD